MPAALNHRARPATLGPELLAWVFSLLDPRELTNVARTNKTMHEVALNIIWEFLPSLIPLLRLFPGSAVVWQDDRIVSKKLRFMNIHTLWSHFRSTVGQDFRRPLQTND
jgi:hypothetical protein